MKIESSRQTWTRDQFLSLVYLTKFGFILSIFSNHFSFKPSSFFRGLEPPILCLDDGPLPRRSVLEPVQVVPCDRVPIPGNPSLVPATSSNVWHYFGSVNFAALNMYHIKYANMFSQYFPAYTVADICGSKCDTREPASELMILIYGRLPEN